MTIEMAYQVLSAVLIAIPIVVVIGTAALLTVGGVIGCTRCAMQALTRGSQPAGAEAKASAKGTPKLA